MTQQHIVIDTIKFISAIHVLVEDFGDDEENPYRDDFMSIFSYALAKNEFIHKSFNAPNSFLESCKILSKESNIKFFALDSHNDDKDVA